MARTFWYTWSWFGLAAAGVLISSHAHAQYQSPFHCMPPAGQQLYEIAANNMIGNWRREPTPANQKTACERSRKVVEVYQKAAKACAENTCTEASYLETCEKKQAKVIEWREKASEVCSKGKKR
jgi:hypothetical protein